MPLHPMTLLFTTLAIAGLPVPDVTASTGERFPDPPSRLEPSHIAATHFVGPRDRKGRRTGVWFAVRKAASAYVFMPACLTGRWRPKTRCPGLLARRNYRKGLANGREVRFDSLGEVSLRGHWRRGLRRGRWTYPLRVRLRPLESVEHERAPAAHSGGLERRRGPPWRLASASYLRGRLHGRFKLTSSNGLVSLRGRFWRGWLDGTWIYDDGAVLRRLVYRRGVPVSDEVAPRASNEEAPAFTAYILAPTPPSPARSRPGASKDRVPRS